MTTPSTLPAPATPPAVPSPDLSAGSLGHVWRLAWPVIISQSLVSAIGLIDVAMLGRLGTDTLAAVGYATQFLFFVNSLLNAIGVACVALMARAIGAGDATRTRAAFATCLVVATSLALLVTLGAWTMPEQILRLVDVPQDVVQLALPYFRLTLTTPLLAAVYLTHEHAFRAHGDTRTPLTLACAITLIKLLFNWLLIFGALGFPELGMTGAAVATGLSQAVGIVLFRQRARSRVETLQLGRRDFARVPAHVRNVLRVAWPAVAEHSVMQLAIMLYFKFLGQYGIAVIAAYNVGVRILSFSWMPGIGLSVASATLMGQALGAGDAPRAVRTGTMAARLSLIVSATLGLTFILLRKPLAGVFTQDPAVLHALDSFLLMLGLAQPFLALHFTLGGALRGAGDTMMPLRAALLGNWLFRVPLAYLFARVLHLDITWVWSVMIIDHLVRASLLSWAFRRGRWQHALASTRASDLIAQRPATSASGAQSP